MKLLEKKMCGMIFAVVLNRVTSIYMSLGVLALDNLPYNGQIR